MDNIMVDLETMGTKSNSAIIAIGAVEFGNKKLGREFYVVVDLQSSIDSRATVEGAAVLWWLRQSDEARSTFDCKGTDLIVALQDFRNFIASVSSERDVKLWGNGSDFDNVILAESYKRLNTPVPWMFYNNRCYRTIKNQFPRVVEKYGVAHNALDDAKSQALHLMKLINV